MRRSIERAAFCSSGTYRRTAAVRVTAEAYTR